MKSVIVSLCVVSALCLLPSAYCPACPLVAVQSVGVQAVAACPSVAVQSLAVVQPAFVQQPVAVQSFAIAAQPVTVQTFAMQPQAVCAQRAQRVGILGRVLGGRRLLPSARSVSVVR
jgi:hypothetical protein